MPRHLLVVVGHEDLTPLGDDLEFRASTRLGKSGKYLDLDRGHQDCDDGGSTTTITTTTTERRRPTPTMSTNGDDEDEAGDDGDSQNSNSRGLAVP